MQAANSFEELTPLSTGTWRSIVALTAVVFISGCGAQMRFPVSETKQEELVERNINVIQVTSENIEQYRRVTRNSLRTGDASNPPRDPRPYTYRVGVGDQLRIQAWSTPERVQLPGDVSLPEGPVINEVGDFYYPFVGSIKARGKTVEQIRVDLTDRLKEYIAEPQVEVAVERFNAHTATVTGRVGNPGPVQLTNVPVRLLDVVNRAGTSESTDLRRILIRRKGAAYRVNLADFMSKGNRSQNPIILPGDLVHIPPIADNKVFTFGEMGTGELPLGEERKTLTEVLAEQGGIDRVRADARGIFVFRRKARGADDFNVYQFNMRHASALILTSDFEMAPLDIVFVTNDPVTRWNDTVGKLVTPFTSFVQVRALANELNN